MDLHARPPNALLRTGLNDESDETVRNADPELRVDINWTGYRRWLASLPQYSL